MRIIILLGPPGAGKGTQAAMLSKEFSYKHFSTGQMMRDAIASGTKIGNKVAEIVNSGKFVQDEIVCKIVFNAIEKEGAINSIILDGFPRTLPQAISFDAFLREKDLYKYVSIINMMLKDIVVIDRLHGRLICARCGHVHHAKYDPPKRASCCNLCYGELFMRPDDALDVVQSRLKIYHELTDPLVHYYKNTGANICSIDVDKPATEVYSDIKACLL